MIQLCSEVGASILKKRQIVFIAVEALYRLLS